MRSATVFAICVAIVSSATLQREQKQKKTARIGSDFSGSDFYGYEYDYVGSEYDLSGSEASRSDFSGSDFYGYWYDYFGSRFDFSASEGSDSV